MKINNIVYFVEGEDEQKIVNTLKSDLLNIKTGKIVQPDTIRFVDEELYKKIIMR